MSGAVSTKVGARCSTTRSQHMRQGVGNATYCGIAGAPARARGLRTAVGALRGVTKGTAEAGALGSKVDKYENANA
jgi:hypothetical protein